MLESLENDETVDTDKMWLEESLKRYHSINSNKSELIDGESVVKEAKSKYQYKKYFPITWREKNS